MTLVNLERGVTCDNIRAVYKRYKLRDVMKQRDGRAAVLYFDSVENAEAAFKNVKVKAEFGLDVEAKY